MAVAMWCGSNGSPVIGRHLVMWCHLARPVGKGHRHLVSFARWVSGIVGIQGQNVMQIGLGIQYSDTPHHQIRDPSSLPHWERTSTFPIGQHIRKQFVHQALPLIIRYSDTPPTPNTGSKFVAPLGQYEYFPNGASMREYAGSMREYAGSVREVCGKYAGVRGKYAASMRLYAGRERERR